MASMLTYDGLICGENGLGSVRIPMAMLAPRPAACGSVSACRSYGLGANTNASPYTVLCGHVDLKASMFSVCVRARVCVCMRACVCVCGMGGVDLTTM